MSDFPDQLPHGEIQELFPDVFYVMGQIRPDFGGNKMQFSRTMTVVRDGNTLTLLNTLRLDQQGLKRLEQLGSVKNIVKLGSFHGRDDAFYMDRYGAAMWALAAMEHGRGVVRDHALNDGQPGPCAGSTTFEFATSSTPEAVLVLERHGGILVSCDSLQNWTGPDEYFDEPTAEMMAKRGFFRSGNIGPGWRNAAKPDAGDFVRLQALEFRHLLSAHGAPLLDQAKPVISGTIKELYGV